MNDILFQISLYINNVNDLVHYCCVNQYLYNKSKTNYFWQLRFNQYQMNTNDLRLCLRTFYNLLDVFISLFLSANKPEILFRGRSNIDNYHIKFNIHILGHQIVSMFGYHGFNQPPLNQNDVITKLTVWYDDSHHATLFFYGYYIYINMNYNPKYLI